MTHGCVLCGVCVTTRLGAQVTSGFKHVQKQWAMPTLFRAIFAPLTRSCNSNRDRDRIVPAQHATTDEQTSCGPDSSSSRSSSQTQRFFKMVPQQFSASIPKCRKLADMQYIRGTDWASDGLCRTGCGVVPHENISHHGRAPTACSVGATNNEEHLALVTASPHGHTRGRARRQVP